MAGVPPWANGACPGAHWDALDHLDRESMKQHPLGGFPIEATWKRGGRLTRSDATNILSRQLRVVSHITHRRADQISACAGMNEARTGLDVKTEYVSTLPRSATPKRARFYLYLQNRCARDLLNKLPIAP